MKEKQKNQVIFLSSNNKIYFYYLIYTSQKFHFHFISSYNAYNYIIIKKDSNNK